MSGAASGSSLDDDVKKYAYGVEFKAKLIGKSQSVVWGEGGWGEFTSFSFCFLMRLNAALVYSSISMIGEAVRLVRLL